MLTYNLRHAGYDPIVDPIRRMGDNKTTYTHTHTHTPLRSHFGLCGSMPSRAEKRLEARLWRVTFHGTPAIAQRAHKKLEHECGWFRKALVSFETSEEDVIVLRWDPPRKYDTVTRFIEQHFEKHLFQVAPVHGTADDKKEDDKKEDGVDVKKKDDAEGKVAASAASCASVGQRLSGGYLVLKLQALLQDCTSSEDRPPKK